MNYNSYCYSSYCNNSYCCHLNCNFTNKMCDNELLEWKCTTTTDKVPEIWKKLNETTREFPKWEWEQRVCDPDVLSKDEFKSKQRAGPYEPYLWDYKDGETEEGDKIILSVPRCIVKRYSHPKKHYTSVVEVHPHFIPMPGRTPIYVDGEAVNDKLVVYSPKSNLVDIYYRKDKDKGKNKDKTKKK